jgi:hypothetical protein
MKTNLLSLFLWITLFISCHEARNPCSLSEEILGNIRKEDSLISLPLIKERDRKMWEVFNEPSLLHTTTETYRFSIHGSFGHIEIYRVEENNDKHILTIKVYERVAKRDTLYSFTKREISKELWTKLKTSLDNYFWTLPGSTGRLGLDGEVWVLEGYKTINDKCTKQQYHRVGQWSPVDTAFINMCNLFIELK